MKNKSDEIGVNVCDRIIRNQLNEKGFKLRKVK